MVRSQSRVPARATVRTYEPRDQKAVERLYTEGLLAGQIAANDTGADIDNIVEAYLQEEASHFWVAEVHGEVVGMIGVAAEEGHTGEVRRLRVDKAFQHTDIAEQLVETALAHCKHHGYLKIRLDTRFDSDAVVDLFDRFGFQHVRTKSVQGKELLEFYLDLYRQPANEKRGE